MKNVSWLKIVEGEWCQPEYAQSRSEKLRVYRRFTEILVILILEMYKIVEKMDLVELAMCNLVSGDSLPFCKNIKRHVYPGNQGTQNKLNLS